MIEAGTLVLLSQVMQFLQSSSLSDSLLCLDQVRDVNRADLVVFLNAVNGENRGTRQMSLRVEIVTAQI